jgi:hypothetical protein
MTYLLGKAYPRAALCFPSARLGESRLSAIGTMAGHEFCILHLVTSTEAHPVCYPVCCMENRSEHEAHYSPQSRICGASHLVKEASLFSVLFDWTMCRFPAGEA